MQNQDLTNLTIFDEVKRTNPARKSFVRQARLFPKDTLIWIQGFIVWKHKDQIAVDDGTGIARIDIHNMKKRDGAFNLQTLKIGNYVMAVGEMAGKFKGRRMGMKATTLRDVTNHGCMMESLWNVEVVDAFLLCVESSAGTGNKLRLNED